MKKIIFSLWILCSWALWAESEDQSKMNVPKLFEILESLADEKVQKSGPSLTFKVSGVEMTCITADYVDRMRIVSPIIHTAKIDEKVKDKMLESNYHSALDARYAVSDHMVFAAFIHPLSSLEKNQIISAVYQVASLKLSFGKTYSSGLLSFGETKKKTPI